MGHSPEIGFEVVLSAIEDTKPATVIQLGDSTDRTVSTEDDSWKPDNCDTPSTVTDYYSDAVDNISDLNRYIINLTPVVWATYVAPFLNFNTRIVPRPLLPANPFQMLNHSYPGRPTTKNKTNATLREENRCSPCCKLLNLHGPIFLEAQKSKNITYENVSPLTNMTSIFDISAIISDIDADINDTTQKASVQTTQSKSSWQSTNCAVQEYLRVAANYCVCSPTVQFSTLNIEINNNKINENINTTTNKNTSQCFSTKRLKVPKQRIRSRLMLKQRLRPPTSIPKSPTTKSGLFDSALFRIEAKSGLTEVTNIRHHGPKNTVKSTKKKRLAVNAQAPPGQGHGFTTALQCKCSDIDACATEMTEKTNSCKNNDECVAFLTKIGDSVKIRSCLEKDHEVMQQLETCAKAKVNGELGCTNDANPKNMTIPLIPVVEATLPPVANDDPQQAPPQPAQGPPELSHYLMCVDQCTMSDMDIIPGKRKKRSPVNCAFKLKCALAPPSEQIQRAYQECETELGIKPQERLAESCACLKAAGVAVQC